VTIKVEPYRKSSPTQCFSSQGFGHSSLQCGHPSRCVKCAGEHSAKDCQKTNDQRPKCVNCEGDHTANYKKCPTYIKQNSCTIYHFHSTYHNYLNKRTPPPITNKMNFKREPNLWIHCNRSNIFTNKERLSDENNDQIKHVINGH